MFTEQNNRICIHQGSYYLLLFRAVLKKKKEGMTSKCFSIAYSKASHKSVKKLKLQRNIIFWKILLLVVIVLLAAINWVKNIDFLGNYPCLLHLRNDQLEMKFWKIINFRDFNCSLFMFHTRGRSSSRYTKVSKKQTILQLSSYDYLRIKRSYRRINLYWMNASFIKL